MTTAQATSLADRILQLKKDVDKAAQQRAKAEAALGLAVRQLADAEDALKQFGVTPETAEAELATLRDQLEATLAELTITLAAETKACQAVLDAAKQAGLA